MPIFNRYTPFGVIKDKYNSCRRAVSFQGFLGNDCAKWPENSNNGPRTLFEFPRSRFIPRFPYKMARELKQSRIHSIPKPTHVINYLQRFHHKALDFKFTWFPTRFNLGFWIGYLFKPQWWFDPFDSQCRRPSRSTVSQNRLTEVYSRDSDKVSASDLRRTSIL
jgi:hypothetical protein